MKQKIDNRCPICSGQMYIVEKVFDKPPGGTVEEYDVTNKPRSKFPTSASGIAIGVTKSVEDFFNSGTTGITLYKRLLICQSCQHTIDITKE